MPMFVLGLYIACSLVPIYWLVCMSLKTNQEILGGFSLIPAHFDLTNYETRTADVQDHDDVLVVPFGLGLSYRHAHTIADVRTAYRFAFDEDLVLMNGSTTEHMNMDEWMVALCGGFEF